MDYMDALAAELDNLGRMIWSMRPTITKGCKCSLLMRWVFREFTVVAYG